MLTRSAPILCALFALSCGPAAHSTPPTNGRPVDEGASRSLAAPVTITVVGTNDLHGHLRALPILGGYLRVLREMRRPRGGAVVLVDGGDMLQGTLESNLLEGAPVVDAYGALGYDAVTIGNHEFDFGPEGEAATPRTPGDDPRGALRARIRHARFPFLSANLLRASGEPLDEAVPASVLFSRGGIGIGVIGVTTEETLRTTTAANVRDLAVAPLAETITREAESLRARGADVVIVVAHAGGDCGRFDNPRDLSSCDEDEEIFAVARTLAPRTVDVIVAGHTHSGVAHFVNGTPIIESYAHGRAFGRVDLEVDPEHGVQRAVVHPPRALCEAGSIASSDCVPGTYEGREVEPDARIAALIRPALERARAAEERLLGVTLSARFAASYGEESAVGNLFTDLMRAARPDADVALTNGGGLRADLPAGPLTYGQLFRASPFDNRFALVRLRAGELASILAQNLQGSSGFFSLSGVRAEARCDDDELLVQLFDERGRRIAPDAELTVATTDFLATGGDGALSALPGDRVTIDDAFVREAMAGVLERRGGTLAPHELYDPARPRVRYEGPRPVTCPARPATREARPASR